MNDCHHQFVVQVIKPEFPGPAVIEVERCKECSLFIYKPLVSRGAIYNRSLKEDLEYETDQE